MPTYEYHCNACGQRFEIMMSLREHESLPHTEPKTSGRTQEPECPKCHSHDTTQDLSVFQAITSSKS